MPLFACLTALKDKISDFSNASSDQSDSRCSTLSLCDQGCQTQLDYCSNSNRSDFHFDGDYNEYSCESLSDKSDLDNDEEVPRLSLKFNGVETSTLHPLLYTPSESQPPDDRHRFFSLEKKNNVQQNVIGQEHKRPISKFSKNETPEPIKPTLKKDTGTNPERSVTHCHRATMTNSNCSAYRRRKSTSSISSTKSQMFVYYVTLPYAAAEEYCQLFTDFVQGRASYDRRFRAIEMLTKCSLGLERINRKVAARYCPPSHTILRITIQGQTADQIALALCKIQSRFPDLMRTAVPDKNSSPEVLGFHCPDQTRSLNEHVLANYAEVINRQAPWHTSKNQQVLQSKRILENARSQIYS